MASEKFNRERKCRVDESDAFIKMLCDALDQLSQCPYESLRSLDELVQALPPEAAFKAQQVLEQIWCSGIERRGATLPTHTLGDLKLSLLCVVLPELRDSDW